MWVWYWLMWVWVLVCAGTVQGGKGVGVYAVKDLSRVELSFDLLGGK
jgi:hypothetical protein